MALCRNRGRTPSVVELGCSHLGTLSVEEAESSADRRSLEAVREAARIRAGWDVRCVDRNWSVVELAVRRRILDIVGRCSPGQAERDSRRRRRTNLVQTYCVYVLRSVESVL